VYNRGGLWRIAPIVVALFLTVASTSAMARVFCAADTPNRGCPAGAAVDPDRIDATLIGQFSPAMPSLRHSTPSSRTNSLGGVS
jgi:hypothetical protein